MLSSPFPTTKKKGGRKGRRGGKRRNERGGQRILRDGFLHRCHGCRCCRHRDQRRRRRRRADRGVWERGEDRRYAAHVLERGATPDGGCAAPDNGTAVLEAVVHSLPHQQQHTMRVYTHEQTQTNTAASCERDSADVSEHWDHTAGREQAEKVCGDGGVDGPVCAVAQEVS